MAIGLYWNHFFIEYTYWICAVSKNILAVISFSRTVYTASQIHQVLGVWTLFFNLLIGITGLWMQRYVFQPSFYTNFDYTIPFKKSDNLNFNIDSTLTKIYQKFPDFTAHVIYFPYQSAGKMAVYGSRESNAFIYSKDLTDLVLVDSTGNIASTRFVNQIADSDRRDIINAQLHFGRYGGRLVQWLYFLAALSTALLSITGFVFYCKNRVLPWLFKRNRNRNI
jgi:uncharacterized iron-regulated membrane protein